MGYNCATKPATSDEGAGNGAPPQPIATDDEPPSSAAEHLAVSHSQAPAYPRDIRTFFSRAMEAMQLKKRPKLEKILVYAKEHGSITNDAAEKLLHISDATASRYLAQLVREGKLVRSGSTSQIRYVPTVGS